MTPTEYAGKSAYHGDVAARYEQDRIGEPLWAVEQEFVRQWAAQCPRGAWVLDLPVGTGRFVELLLAAGLRVRAMDISEDMLAEVRKRPMPADASCVIERGDAERLALADDSVDYVLCWRLFHLLPLETVGRVLGEFRRVCRGRIVVQVLPVRTGFASVIPAAFKAVVRPLRQTIARQPATPWAHIPSFVHGERDLLRLFRRQRLAVVDAVTLASYQGFPVRVYTLERSGELNG
jgi:ubiquinone/menaquinone biosynthesis C-methylase UbiE